MRRLTLCAVQHAGLDPRAAPASRPAERARASARREQPAAARSAHRPRPRATALRQPPQRAPRPAAPPRCNPPSSTLQPYVYSGLQPHVYSRCASSPSGRRRPPSSAPGGRARSRRACGGMLRVPCPALPMPCHAVPCRAVPCRAMPCPAVPCPPSAWWRAPGGRDGPDVTPRCSLGAALGPGRHCGSRGLQRSAAEAAPLQAATRS